MVLQMQGLMDPYSPLRRSCRIVRLVREWRGRKRVSDGVRQSRFSDVGEGRIRAVGLTRGRWLLLSCLVREVDDDGDGSESVLAVTHGMWWTGV